MASAGFDSQTARMPIVIEQASAEHALRGPAVGSIKGFVSVLEHESVREREQTALRYSTPQGHFHDRNAEKPHSRSVIKSFTSSSPTLKRTSPCE
jgi:hypothetical protein